MWYWLKTAKEGLKLQQTINISLYVVLTEDSKGGPETAANNKHMLSVFQDSMWYCCLKLQQTIPHDTDMWYCLLTVSGPPLKLQQTIPHDHCHVVLFADSFKGGPETAANNKHITVMWYCLLTVSKEGLKLSQYHMTVTYHCHLVCCLQRRAWNCTNMTVICLLFAEPVSGPPLLSSVNTTYQWYVYCLLQFQALLWNFSQYHINMICLLYAEFEDLKGGPETTWQWYVYCLLQFQALLCCQLRIPHDSDMFIVCWGQQRRAWNCSVNTTWQWYVYCLLQFQALLWNCPQTIPHDTVMWYCLLTAGPPLLSSNNTTWSLIMWYCLLQFQALLLFSVNTTWQWYVYCLLQCGIVLTDTTWQWYVYCLLSFRPWNCLQSIHMTVICLLFAAVSGPPLLSSLIPQQWYVYCLPETAANNTTYHCHVYCLLQFQALLCCSSQ